MDLITWVLLIVGLFVAGLVAGVLLHATIVKEYDKAVTALKTDFDAIATRVRSLEQGVVSKVETTAGTVKKAL